MSGTVAASPAAPHLSVRSCVEELGLDYLHLGDPSVATSIVTRLTGT
jgi:hypothetical protein